MVVDVVGGGVDEEALVDDLLDGVNLDVVGVVALSVCHFLTISLFNWLHLSFCYLIPLAWQK